MPARLALTALALAAVVTTGPAASATAAGPDPVLRGLETLVRSDGAPGAPASVMEGGRRERPHLCRG